MILCALTVVPRIAFAWYALLQHGALHIYGTFESCQIAASLVRGQGYSSPYGYWSGPTAWLPPAYPMIVALTFKLFGTWTLQLVSLCHKYRLCHAYDTPDISDWFALLRANHGLRRLFALGNGSGHDRILRADSESSLSALLVAIGVAWYLRLADSAANWQEWMGYGLFWSVAALTNTALVLLMPLMVVPLLFRRLAELRYRALVALLAFVLALLPWSVRNYVEFHKLVPIRGNFGANLWYGNHPGVKGPDDQSLNPTHNRQELRTYIDMKEAAYNSSREQMAMNFIQANPVQFLRLSWSRSLFFWTDSPLYGHLLPTCSSTLAFIGLFLTLRRRTALVASPFASALLLFPLPYYVTHTESFYLHPIEPLLLLLTVYPCALLLERATPQSSGNRLTGLRFPVVEAQKSLHALPTSFVVAPDFRPFE